MIHDGKRARKIIELHAQTTPFDFVTNFDSDVHVSVSDSTVSNLLEESPGKSGL